MAAIIQLQHRSFFFPLRLESPTLMTLQGFSLFNIIYFLTLTRIHLHHMYHKYKMLQERTPKLNVWLIYLFYLVNIQ